MKKKAISKMSYAEMVAQRDKLRKDLLNLRVEQVMSHLDNPLALRTTRISATPRHPSRELGNGS